MVTLRRDKLPIYSNLVKHFLEESTPCETLHSNSVSEEIHFQQAQISSAQRKTLFEVISSQYQQDGLMVPENFAHITSEKTFCITAGQQLNYLGGPAFILYKILSVLGQVKLWERKFPEHHFIPVFWMATEDHDFDEIKSVEINNTTYELAVEENKGAAGRMVLSKGLSQEAILSVSNENMELRAVLEQCFKKGQNMASAYRLFLHLLLGNKGLIVIDADHKDLKKIFSSIIQEEITTQRAKTGMESLKPVFKACHWKFQINPMESNFFYLDKGLRKKITKSADLYYCGEHQFTESDIKNRIQEHPHFFSPGVAMRPLYQQKVLPNVQSILGPSELAYWLQLKPVFDHFCIHYPKIMLRDQIIITGDKFNKNLNKTKLDVSDVFMDINQLKTYFTMKSLYTKSVFDDNLWNAFFDSAKKEIDQIDATLSNSLMALKTRTKKQLDKLDWKIKKSIQLKNASSMAQIEYMHNQIWPQGVFQERQWSFIQAFIILKKLKLDTIIETLSLSNGKMLVVNEE